jgi:selenocysteine lyase/cysteine desulfurase
VDPVALRSQFPVLERLAYLNAGTDGPAPTVAVELARRELEFQLVEGRTSAHFERRFELQDELRSGYATVLGCRTEDMALMTSTSEGLGRVLAGMDLGPGDEIVTSDQEHPGLNGPLQAAQSRGARIRAVPLADVADAVGPQTTLVACSHVGWVSGELAPAALAEVGVPVVLDGAQGAGAVPVDVGKLRCAAYSVSGQKWLCGADGTGGLYIAPEFRERVRAIAPAYMAFEDPSRGLDSPLKPDAQRYDTPSLPREGVAFSSAALAVLRDADFNAVLARGPLLADRLAERLAERGHTVAPRAHTTLVSWEDDDPEATRDRLKGVDVIVRNLPGRSLVRASIGAWSSDEDLERLLEAL